MDMKMAAQKRIGRHGNADAEESLDATGSVRSRDVRRISNLCVSPIPSNIAVVTVLITKILQKKALTTHHAISHLGRRDFVCAVEGCERAFGYKHILQRHQARQHGNDRTAAEKDEGCEHNADTDGESSEAECPQPKKRKSRLQSQNISIINEITGVAYEERTANAPAPLRCPHPAMEGFPSAPSVERLCNSYGDATPCEYVFGRAYDLRRHLRAIHGVELYKETVDAWAQKIRG